MQRLAASEVEIAHLKAVHDRHTDLAINVAGLRSEIATLKATVAELQRKGTP